VGVGRRAVPVGRVHRPAKVGELHLAADAEQEVFGLDVAVDDVAAVQVLQGQRDLRDVLRRPLVAELALLAQNLEQLALRGVLQNQVDALQGPDRSEGR